MDFTYLSNLSHKQQSKNFVKKKQVLPISKCNPSSKVATSAVQQFLARKQEEERKKYEEYRKRKDELLSLRSQNSKSNKKAKLMASRTRDNDFSKIKLTEEEEEAKASREKELRRKGLFSKVDRMKARIELEERDSQLPRKRKRKSHLSNSNEQPNGINTTDSFVKIEQKIDSSCNSEKNEAGKKTSSYKPKPAPVIDYKNLLQVAAKKQFEPIPLHEDFEDFEEGSDEYEEDEEAYSDNTERLPNKNLEHNNSLKENRAIEKQPQMLYKRVEKEQLDSKSHAHESRQNKENTYRSSNHNSNNRQLHKLSGEHDKHLHDSSRSNTSLPQSGSSRKSSDGTAPHGKENHSVQKLNHSHSSKHRYDNTNTDRNTGISKNNCSISKSNLVKEKSKKSEVPSQDRTDSKVLFNHSQSSGTIAQKKKHEETFRNSIKGLSDKRSNGQYISHSKNNQNMQTSISKQHLKKGTSECENISSDFGGHKKVEPMHSFRIPKKISSKAYSPEDGTPSYYTDGVSNSLDVKQLSSEKIASTKASDNCGLKSDKKFSEEKLKKQTLSDDRTSKSHTKFNHVNEVTKNKHINETSSHKRSVETSHRLIHRSDSRLKWKSSHSSIPEKAPLNRSDKTCNSNEYFTTEGQAKSLHKSAVENSSKSRPKGRSGSASSSEVSQYFTEEFSIGESREKTDNFKHYSNKKNLNYDKDNAKTKDHNRAKVHGHSLQTADHIKGCKYDKNKIQESQYFTEHCADDEKNSTNANSKCDKKNVAYQREKQSKHSQYFTENFAAGRNSIEKSNRKASDKDSKKSTPHQIQIDVKQSQYFTEGFERSVAKKDKDSTCKYKYNKRSAVPQKESQYFTEDFVKAEPGRTKGDEQSCKYDTVTSLPPKEKKENEPQYFTEQYTTKRSEMKKNSANCKYDKRAAPSKKENQINESHYFTENFTTNQTKTRNNSSSDCIKRTNFSQKEKQRDYSQYFTEKSGMDENNKSNINSKHYKRNAGSEKVKQTNPAQYFTESFISDEHHLTKAGRNESYKHARSGIIAQKEKARSNQSSSKVEEYIPTKITKTVSNVEEYTPGEITSDIEEYIPTKITNKVDEYVPTKIVNKENLPRRASSTSNHTSHNYSEKHIKTSKIDRIDCYKSNEVRKILKRPREPSEEVEPHQSKVSRYENSGNDKADANNLKKEKSVSYHHSAMKSKSSLNYSSTQSEKNKQPTEISRSKEKIRDRTNGQIRSSKVLNYEHNFNQKEKVTSSSHLNSKLKDSFRRVPKSELHRKQDGNPPSEKVDSVKRLLPPGSSSFLKTALPPKDKIIPASSMAQMMNKKILQSKPTQEAASIKNQKFEMAKSNNKSADDAKTATHQTKSDITSFSRSKADHVKNLSAKSVAYHQKVNSSSQMTERERKADVEHRKKQIEDGHKTPVKKLISNQDRKAKQREYDNRVRNRFSRPSPRMFIKRNMESDDEEEDEDEDEDDMSDFIDDGPIEEDEEDYSRYIREIFGYDRRRYCYEEEFDDREMETSYAQQMKEERRSARIGYLEDLEDMRKEEEEKKRKAKSKKT